MIQTNKPPEGEGSANTPDFRQVFIARVHQVLEGGYRRLKPEEYANEEEPAITGELRKAMNDFLRSISAPDWADYFSVHDDPPVDDSVRKGKRRNRIDIRVDSSIPRPGDSFSFEAKRLARGFTVTIYLGDDGLGSFLSGDYARDDDDAGMIGYIQDDDVAHWSGAIATAMQSNAAKYNVYGNTTWTRFPVNGGPEHAFISEHIRTQVGRPITIYHSLLLFCLTEKKKTKHRKRKRA